MTNLTLSGLKAKNQNYNTEFRLYPKVRKTPVITVQPIDGFNQFTWIALQSGSDISYIKIKPSTSTISMVEGTEFSIETFVLDPSNLSSQVDDKNLTYIWRRDGSPLYELNSENQLKGTSNFYISASLCKRDISGIYQLEVTNKYGSTFSTELEIDVINKKYHPYLYKNLIVNPNGTKGLEAWSGDGDFKVDEFALADRNHASIPKEVYEPYRSPYVKQFNFSIYPNETRLSYWFDEVKSGNFQTTSPSLQQYYKWLISNFHPTLVDTDEPGFGNWGSFFPSWNYIDRVNLNEQLFGLDEIVDRPKTYFTRDKIKFAKFGGKAKCQAYQDIDVTEIANLIDGETYGIDRLILHFFAYIGIGISNYEIEYEDVSDGQVKDNTIPMVYDAYISGAYAPEDIKPTLIPLYTASLDTEPCYCCPSIGNEGPFVFVKSDTDVVLKPITDDTTEIKIEFYDQSFNLIEFKTIQGPTDKDIWSVKEKFFVPYYLGNLYSWMLDATTQEFRIFGQRYTTMDAIRGVDDKDINVKDINAEWMQSYHYPLYDVFSNEYRRVDKHDRGAAAMFGINEDIAVPRGTRTIRVNIIFNHKSNTLFDANPKLKGWNDREIYYDYYTNRQTSDRLFEYGNPRCGVTSMHLSLHPDEVIVTSSYNTYKIPIGNVWYKQRKRLENVNEFWTVKQQEEMEVSSLIYKDIRPDLDVQFPTSLFTGPTSTQNIIELFSQLGLDVGSINIVPNISQQLPTPGPITQTGNLSSYPTTPITLIADSTWNYYKWQAEYNNTFYNCTGNSTEQTFVLDQQPVLTTYRVLVSLDGITYINSDPYILQ